jgi:hypothetical protein
MKQILPFFVEFNVPSIRLVVDLLEKRSCEMRRRIIALLFIIGIVAGTAIFVPRTAQAEHNIPPEECPNRDWEGRLTILEPPAGATVDPRLDFRLMWTRYPDPDNEMLFYYVQVFVPDPEVYDPNEQGLIDQDDGEGVLFRAFRYVPDRDRDALRCNPVMIVNAPLLQMGYPSTIIITPMGATDELKAQYKPLAEPNEPHTIMVG